MKFPKCFNVTVTITLDQGPGSRSTKDSKRMPCSIWRRSIDHGLPRLLSQNHRILCLRWSDWRYRCQKGRSFRKMKKNINYFFLSHREIPRQRGSNTVQVSVGGTHPSFHSGNLWKKELYFTQKKFTPKKKFYPKKNFSQKTRPPKK